MNTRIKFEPHPYQVAAMAHIWRNTRAALFLDMGLGKTVVTLTVIKNKLDCVEILKPLVVAPKLVAEQTWNTEADKWKHLEGLTIQRIVGTAKERIRALSVKADVYIIGRDNIAWLVDYFGVKFPFDYLILDELSSFKSRTSARFKAIRKIRSKLQGIIGLTGTPAPNGLLDLWAQIYLLDGGERLEKTIGAYRERYFKVDKTNGIIAYSYKLREGSQAAIHRKIDDICLSMKAKDWLDLKPRIDVTIPIELPDMKAYKDFVKTEVLKLVGPDNQSVVISPVHAAGLYNKLLQYCNGAVYDDKGNYHVVNDTKLDMLCEKIEALDGMPVLVFYQFRSDAERIRARIKDVHGIKNKQDVEDWNAGKIRVALVHAAGVGHGNNLQFGGHHLIWFGVPWNLEEYLQACGRLDRQGQIFNVINMHLLCAGTVEDIVATRLSEKDLTQEKLMNALRKELNF